MNPVVRTRGAEDEGAALLDPLAEDEDEKEDEAPFIVMLDSEVDASVVPLTVGRLLPASAVVRCAVDVSGCAALVRRLFASVFGFSGVILILLNVA